MVPFTVRSDLEVWGLSLIMPCSLPAGLGATGGMVGSLLPVPGRFLVNPLGFGADLESKSKHRI